MNGDGNKPRVSIGVPVYNGARYLAETLDSLLAQTFRDFELIVSDNGSTDRTEEICRSYAERDSRIQYYRSETNRGAAWNHNRVFELASGEYFKWQCHDDLCHPEFLEKCKAVLDKDGAVVLCYSRFLRIDEAGRPVGRRGRGWYGEASSGIESAGRPHERFRSLLMRRDTCEEIYGVMRSSIVRQTRLIGSYTQSDDNFLAELALRGRFYEVPERLFYYRLHPNMSTHAYRNRVERMAWFDPAAADRLAIPFLRQLSEYVSLVFRAPVPWIERLRCYRHLASWTWKFRRWFEADLEDVVFTGTLVPFLKRWAPWTRPIWHAFTRMARG